MIKHKFFKKDLPKNIQHLVNNSNFFYSDDYIDYIGKQGGKVVFLYSTNFVLLTIINKKLIFNYCQFPSEYIIIDSNRNAQGQNFLDDSIKLLKREFNIHWINPTSSQSFFQDYPSNSFRIPFGSHVINLQNTKENIWSNVHSKHRNSIRKAIKSNLKIEFGSIELLDDYMILDSQTWERSGKKGVSKSYYEDIIKTCKLNVLVVIAYKDLIPQGGAIFFYNKKMSYYMFGASKNNPESGSMNCLHWETLLYFKAKDIEKYSFVGCRINEDVDSIYHGIQRFKSRFGGELIQGYMFKVIINPFYYKLAMIIRLVLKKGAGKDAIDQEINKWEELNIQNEA